MSVTISNLLILPDSSNLIRLAVTIFCLAIQDLLNFSNLSVLSTYNQIQAAIEIHLIPVLPRFSNLLVLARLSFFLENPLYPQIPTVEFFIHVSQLSIFLEKRT